MRGSGIREVMDLAAGMGDVLHLEVGEPDFPTPRHIVDERVIAVYSFSKTYAMTGWRIGYVVAPAAIAGVITKLQEPVVSCASAISQKAAEVSLAGPQTCVLEMRNAYRQRRDAALAGAADQRVVEEGVRRLVAALTLATPPPSLTYVI